MPSVRSAPRPSHSRAGAALGALALALAAPPVLAAAPDPLTDDESLLFEDVSHVRTASRYEQDTREAPAAISVITAKDIRRFGYHSVAEALANTRGFWMSNDRNYSYVGARGFSVPGDYNSRILLMVDGHRLNDNVFNQAFLGTEELVDIDLVERIEIVRGPTSSLYGTNALFGIINIVTQQGRWQDGSQFRAEAGSWGARRASGVIGMQTMDGVEALFGGSLYRSDGPDLYFPAFDDPATWDGVAAGLDGDRYQRAFGKIVNGPMTVLAGFNSRRKHIPTASWGTDFGDPDTWTRDGRSFASLRLEKAMAAGTHIEADLSFDRYDYRASFAYGDGDSHERAEGQWITASSQVDRFVGRHRVLVGGEARWDLRATQRNDEAGDITLDADRTGLVLAAFAQDELPLVDGVRLNVGVRHDRYDTFGSTTHPRAALVWTPGETVAVKLLYGSAFRAPTPFELDFDDGGRIQKSPTDLGPERTTSLEAIVEGSLSRSLGGTVSVFRQQTEDLIATVQDPSDSLLVFDNVGKVRAEGLEAGLSWTHGRVRLAADWTYQRSREPDTGATSPNAPRHLLSGRAVVPLTRASRAGFVVRRVDRQETVFGTEVPACTVGDLTLSSDWLGGRSTLDVTCSNLFDAEYATPAGPEQAMPTIPQDGRSYRVVIGVRL